VHAPKLIKEVCSPLGFVKRNRLLETIGSFRGDVRQTRKLIIKGLESSSNTKRLLEDTAFHFKCFTEATFCADVMDVTGSLDGMPDSNVAAYFSDLRWMGTNGAENQIKNPLDRDTYVLAVATFNRIVDMDNAWTEGRVDEIPEMLRQTSDDWVQMGNRRLKAELSRKFAVGAVRLLRHRLSLTSAHK
jgi:hypothetical protein